MVDLKTYETEMREQHATLTKAFEDSQATAERVWAEHEAHSRALTEFRTRYGHVLKALDAHLVKVEG